jgi:hypothetical protein
MPARTLAIAAAISLKSEADVTKNTARSRKAFFTIALGVLFGLPLNIAQFTSAQAQGTKFTGEITDEKLNCVQSPIKAVPGITRKEACVLYWTRYANPPSKYVLYDAATKTAYQLDKQDVVQPFVGERVEVTGTLNSATKMITVRDIRKP